MRTMASRLGFMTAPVGALLLLTWSWLVIADSTLRQEVGGLRGGSIYVSKCTKTCDQYNNYSTNCIPQVPGQDTTGNACTTCGKGSTDISTLEQANSQCGATSPPGYKLDTTSQDCGNQITGTCRRNGCVDNLTYTNNPCNDPYSVISQ